MRRKFSPTNKYGRWTVLEKAVRNRSGKLRWTCKCDCGTERIVLQDTLLSGASQSCGCLSVESFVHRNRVNKRTHGNTVGGYSPEYRAWLHIRNRCCNPNVKDFPHYGGRGITICDRWRDSFEAFLADMGKRPSSRHSVDRIDVNANYTPGNCRWATSRQQQNNRRDNFIVIVGGKTITLRDACRSAGVNYNLVWLRINRQGWTLFEAVTTPRRANAGDGSHLLPISTKLSDESLRLMFLGSECIGVEYVRRQQKMNFKVAA